MGRGGKLTTTTYYCGVTQKVGHRKFMSELVVTSAYSSEKGEWLGAPGSQNRVATPEDVGQAIEELNGIDLYRLRRYATYCMMGTDYNDPMDLIQEALVRTVAAAAGEKGRNWPLDIPFVVYLKNTIRGLANDSRESGSQQKVAHLEEMVREGETIEDVLGQHQHRHGDALSQAVALEEAVERQDRAKACTDRIEAHFSDDPQVSWIIEGHKEGWSAKEIMEIAGMNSTQYSTARRRFRRGVDQLFPETTNHD